MLRQATMIGVVLALLTPLEAVAQQPFELAGHWTGGVTRLGALQTLDIELARSPDGGLRGTYDIPELGLYGEPLRELASTDSTIAFRILYGPFTLRINRDDAQLTALNSRWNPPVGMHLKRAALTARYDTTGFTVANAGALIRGTLYLPLADEAVPLLVVAGGSSQTTRNSWEYRGWGPALASRGIAVAVYDRRGFGASTGDSVAVNLRTEAADVAAIIDSLTQRADIDARHAGVLGASRGGWVAPLAATMTAKITFLVMESAPAVSVLEQESQRVRHTEPTDSLSEADIAAAAAYTRLVLRAAMDSAAWPEVVAASAAARTAPWQDVVQIPESRDDLSWWRDNTFDQAALLARIDLPVLAFFGADDRLVPPAENADLLRNALERGGSRVTMFVVPRAGHGLFSFATLRGGAWEWPEKYWVWSSKARGVFDTVAAWITELQAR